MVRFSMIKYFFYLCKILNDGGVQRDVPQNRARSSQVAQQRSAVNINLKNEEINEPSLNGTRLDSLRKNDWKLDGIP